MVNKYTLITDNESDILLTIKHDENRPEIIALFPKEHKSTAEFICDFLNKEKFGDTLETKSYLKD